MEPSTVAGNPARVSSGGTVFMPGGLRSPAREYQYPPVKSSEAFTHVILSPNGHLGLSDAVEFRLGESEDDLTPLLLWSGPNAAVQQLPASDKRIEADIFRFPRPVTSLIIRCRVVSGGESVRIDRLGITLYDPGQQHPGTSTPASVRGTKSPLAVPFISQFGIGGEDDDSRCCPTAALMVLRFWGKEVSREEVIAYSYDRTNRIYGNWSLTAAAMSQYRVPAWVERHLSWGTLAQYLDAGQPVITSLAWQDGALTGAPIVQSRGHLIVVRGITKNGDIIVNDPAGRTVEEGQRIYQRDEFQRAWLGHGGFAIHAGPVGGGDG